MRRLEAEGIPFVAVDLEPVFGSIEGYTDILDRAVQALERSTGRPPVIVAHSMGGLAVRAWIAQGNETRFRHAVTIATPHQGTRIARRGFSANTREMGIDSVWLNRLRQRENPAIYRRFTCFWGHCDNIVFPTENATLPGADNHHLASTPHVQMVFHSAVLDEVLRLTAESPLPSLTQLVRDSTF
jgi:triacylglycerol esterase/lipase EstA (alpha/beta hydrolase family)